MKVDALNSPGLLPNAQRLNREVIHAVSHLEVMRGLNVAAVPTAAVTFRAYLLEVVAYLDANVGTTAP